MKRRVIALLMVLAVMVGVLAGCTGTTETGSQPTKAAEPTKASAPTEASKPTPVPDSQTVAQQSLPKHQS